MISSQELKAIFEYTWYVTSVDQEAKKEHAPIHPLYILDKCAIYEKHRVNKLPWHADI